MATVRFTAAELQRFTGKMSESQLEEAITNLGMPVDAIENGEFTLDITPNRVDMLSVEGLGRAIASYTGKKTGLREYTATSSGATLDVDQNLKNIRPYIVGAFIRDIEVDEPALLSIIQMQEKLHDTYGRKRRKVSIGIHDASRLKPPFTYKAVGLSEVKFVPLDETRAMTPKEILEAHPKGVAYAHLLQGFDKVPLLLDSKEQVLSLPPIINGELTRVSEKTRVLFLDITGISEHAVSDVLNVIATSLADRGGKIETLEIRHPGSKKITPELSPKKMELDLGFANKLLGHEFAPAEAAKLLTRMGFDSAAKENTLTVSCPCYRADLLHQVDLVEDLAIAFGYNSLEPELPQFYTVGKAIRRFESERSSMLGLGFCETIGNTLIDEKTNFDCMNLERGTAARIKNPLTVEFTMMRTHVLPTLLSTLSHSKNEKMPIKLFEIGRCANEKGVLQERMAGVWTDSEVSFSEIKSVVESVLFESDWDYEIKSGEAPSFIKGRCARVLRKGKEAGFFGEIHPSVLENMGLEQPVGAFELELGVETHA